jgi:glycosyltransferase involved in cell wall biosynthesis
VLVPSEHSKGLASENPRADQTIFLFSFTRGFGGGEMSLGTLVPYLARQARCVIFVENDRHLRQVAGLDLPSVDIVRVARGNSPWSFLRTLWTVQRQILLRWPTAILANQYKSAFVMALLTFLYFPKRILRSIYIRDFGFYWLPFILWRLPDALLLAPSPAIFEHRKFRRAGLAKHRCEVIPNAVHLPELTEEEKSGDGSIVFCGRLVPWKGVDLLIEAFHRVHERNHATRLVIAGEKVDLSYVSKLHQAVRERGLDHCVEFREFTWDLDGLYRNASVVAVPSVSIPPGPESFSRVLIEGWAYAKPVVAFDAGGPHHLIENGSNGYLVSEGNVAEFADRLIELLAMPELRRRLGDAGQQKVFREFDPDRIARRLFASITQADRPQ